MPSSAQELSETLDRISEALASAPEERRRFDVWAEELLGGLVRAERESRLALRWQAMQLRLQLLELQRQTTARRGTTGRTELLRLARVEWLDAVLDLVDSLTDGDLIAAA
jgi:hypothetical protein